jgi:hypothetical protein
VLINRDINSLTEIEKEIIKNWFNFTNYLSGSIIKFEFYEGYYWYEKKKKKVKKNNYLQVEFLGQ